jgi:phosphotransferase system HPr (HPr) family protein
MALEHGIHARPAAQLALALKRLRADVELRFQGRQADARSATALMSLGVRQGDLVEIQACGADAQEALEALQTVLSRPARGALPAAGPRTAPSVPTRPMPAQTLRPGDVLRGVVASRGLAVGRAAVLRRQEFVVAESGAGIEHESAELRRARIEVRGRLERSLQTAAGAAAEVVTAHLALLDQAMWDKYGLAKLTGDKFKSNTLIVEQKAGSADPGNVQDADGAYSGHDNSIPALQRRGVVFIACHNAIWEVSERLIRGGANPDGLSLEALAAELTNHLIPGTVLSPGAVATMLELQMAGFHYAYAK